MREQTEAMQLPRFLWVPFELGRPFGAPNEPDFQRRVLRMALELTERTDGPIVLADFPDDAPMSDDDTPWSCPVSFASAATDEQTPVEAVHREMQGLAPWAELALVPPPNTAMTMEEMVDLLGRVADGDEVAEAMEAEALIEGVRLAADDVRTWYLHAASRQPGRATSHERNAWIWQDTALGRLLGAVAARLIDHPDPTVRLFAERAVVPRDHLDALVAEHRQGDPDD